MDADQLARVEQLERRVAHLDQEVARLRARLGDDASSVASGGSTTPPTVRSSRAAWPAPEPLPPVAATPSHGPTHLAVDSETILKWGGVGLVLLAVGFAVSTAISRDWIGPELQLAGALLVSGLFVAAGLRLRSTRPGWTHALCSTGVLAFFTTFASDLFLDRATDTIAFACTTAVVVGALWLARSIASEWVAAATLVGGAIGWAVIADGSVPFVATLVWFVVLVGVGVALSVEQRWHATRPVAHLIGMIALISLAADSGGVAEPWLLGLATVLLAGSLTTVPSNGDLTANWQQLEIQLAAATAPFGFLVAMIAGLHDRSDATIAMVAFAIAAVTAVATLAIRSRIRHPHVVSLVLGASVTTSIGLAVLLSTTAVLVALAVQAAGLVLLSRSFGHNARVLINAAVLATIAAATTTTEMVEAWTDDAAWGDDVAHLLVVAAIAVAVWFIDRLDVRRIGAVAVLAMVLVLTGSVLVHAPQGQAVVSITWAAIGTTVFVVGAVRKRADAAAVGLAVIGLTVGKLLTIDLQEVDTLWRAGLFFLIGIGLLRLGFLLPRLTGNGVADAPAADGSEGGQVDNSTAEHPPRVEH